MRTRDAINLQFGKYLKIHATGWGLVALVVVCAIVVVGSADQWLNSWIAGSR